MINIKWHKAHVIGYAIVIMVGLCGCQGSKSNDAQAPVPSITAQSSTENIHPAQDSLNQSPSQKPQNRRGRLLFKQYCVQCHGIDGTLGVSGAKDLSVSTLSLEERISQITNGKGLMTPYKDVLSAEQIESVARYVEELRD